MRSLSICCYALLAIGNCVQAGTFEEKVLPLLQANCTPCHDEQTRTSGFPIATLKSFVAGGARHGTTVQPGHPEKSIVVQMLKGEIKPQMPFGQQLPATALATIVSWIREDAHEISAALPEQTKYWAFIRQICCK